MSAEKWIIGQGNDSLRHLFVIHTDNPFFLARILDDDDPAAVSGLTYDIGNGLVLAELQIFDDELPADDLIVEAALVIRAHPLVVNTFEIAV